VFYIFIGLVQIMTRLIFLLFLTISCNNYRITSMAAVDSQITGAGEITYLGSAGYLISYKNKSILTAPFFSNPPLEKVLFGNISANTSVIDRYFPQNTNPDALLIGHAHYDHLLDIPYISQKYMPDTKIYGSVTAQNILAPVFGQSKIITINKYAASQENVGAWFIINSDQQKGAIRFMAIESGHAPHVGLPGFNFSLFKGKITEPLMALPEKAEGWKEGQTFSFLIDFIVDDGEIDFRIFYQDAASPPPLGLPSSVLLKDGRQIDLAILCVPGYQQVEDYPEAFIKVLNPKNIILGHWENFFAPYTQNPDSLQPVPFLNPADFINRLEKVLSQDAKWYLPAPGTKFLF
jgi:hypothetical protein